MKKYKLKQGIQISYGVVRTEGEWFSIGYCPNLLPDLFEEVVEPEIKENRELMEIYIRRLGLRLKPLES